MIANIRLQTLKDPGEFQVCELVDEIVSVTVINHPISYKDTILYEGDVYKVYDIIHHIFRSEIRELEVIAQRRITHAR